MAMNPGYLTIFVVCSAGILLASGWKEFLLKDMSHRSILFFFAGWLIFSMFTWVMTFHAERIQLNLAYVFLLIFCFILFFRIRSGREKMQAITAALLLCLLDFI